MNGDIYVVIQPSNQKKDYHNPKNFAKVDFTVEESWVIDLWLEILAKIESGNYICNY